jgi:hypothetical protein
MLHPHDHGAAQAAETTSVSIPLPRRLARINAITELAAQIAGIPSSAPQGASYTWTEPRPGIVEITVRASDRAFTRRAVLAMIDEKRWDLPRAERLRDQLLEELFVDLVRMAAETLPAARPGLVKSRAPKLTLLGRMKFVGTLVRIAALTLLRGHAGGVR